MWTVTKNNAEGAEHECKNNWLLDELLDACEGLLTYFKHTMSW